MGDLPSCFKFLVKRCTPARPRAFDKKHLRNATRSHRHGLSDRQQLYQSSGTARCVTPEARLWLAARAVWAGAPSLMTRRKSAPNDDVAPMFHRRFDTLF